MVLVFLVLIFFLGNLRTAIIAAINIPLAMLGAFILLYLTGTPANLLSLGAVDFGIIIDSTIIVVENIYRHLTTETEPGRHVEQYRGRRPGSRRTDVLFDPDLPDRFPAAVHDGGRGRRDLLADVTYLCLCADNRDPARGDAVAGAEFFCSTRE